MRNSKSDHQAKIEEACNQLRANPNLSILTVARVHGLNDKTLGNHYHGRTKFHSQAHNMQQSLNKEEEEVVVRWINVMDDQGTPPRRRHVRDMVEFLINQGNLSDSAALGKHWTDRFLKRHPDIAHKVARPINKDRALAQEPARLESFFNRLSEVRSRFKIIDEDIWNSDEKGFAIGQAIGGKVFCRAGKRNARLIQNGGREWVTLLDTISAGGISIPPFFVYQAKTQREGWHDYTERDEATFSISATGYMNKSLSFKWLKEHFAIYCKPSTPAACRLLILDNHTSHQDFNFYQYCWTNQIKLLFFPSHLTHILQSLDQNPFGAIGTFYRQQVEEFLRVHGVYSTIHMGDFFPMVMDARRKALTSLNIKAAFRCTGIAPFNRRRVLMNPDLQNPTPSHQTHQNLRPQASNDSPMSQIQNLEEEMKVVDSLELAKQIASELSSIAKTASAQCSVTEKQYNDELKKRKASKSKAGAIITRAEVIGRKALDKAYQAKIVQREKAKQTAEKKKKLEEKGGTRRRKRQCAESESSETLGSEEEEDCLDIAERLAENAGSSRVRKRALSQRIQAPLGTPEQRPALHHTSINKRRNPQRSTLHCRSLEEDACSDTGAGVE